MASQSNSRTKNSIRNILVALLSQMLTIVISFVSRSVFVHVLGKEYLGINGLFGNILSILSLAEMGIGAAIIYSLYKPLADDNKEKVRALMRIFKITYVSIGCFIIVAGISLTPFLGYFMKEIPDIPNLSLIYILYILSNASAYFFSYKGALINADQKQYITTAISHGVTLIMHIAQIIVLLVTGNYILFLILMLVFTLGKNVAISVMADRLYPYLKEISTYQLQKTEKDEIVQNVKAMIMHKIGGIVVDSTDNILISKLVSVAVVGLYSNYYLITHTLTTMYNLVFNSIIASAGNLGATSDKQKVYENYKTLDLAVRQLYCISFVCLLNLINPFIVLWIGEGYTFSMGMVLMICLNFYFTGMRNSLLTYRSALGLFWKDRWKAVAEAVVNLVVSIYLGHRYGAIGIFIGTATSTMCVCFLIEPYIVYKYGFGKEVLPYYMTYFVNTILTLVIGFSIYWFVNTLPIASDVLRFIVTMFLTISIPFIVFFIIYGKSKEYIRLQTIILSKIKKKK